MVSVLEDKVTARILGTVIVYAIIYLLFFGEDLLKGKKFLDIGYCGCAL